MIKFQKIYITGFGSMEHETEFKLNRPGLNIIIAKNGSGKTTIFSALFWVLYGYTLKDTKSVNTWKHIRDDDYQGTKVRIKFFKGSDKYEVIRFSEYQGKYNNVRGLNRLVLLINGEPSPIRDKKEIQAEINRVVGYTGDLFKNSVIFGQRLKRLIQESGPNKKKVFEEAFEANYLNIAKTKADNDLKNALSEYKELEYESNTKKSDLSSARSERERIKAAIEAFSITQAERVKHLEKEKANLQVTIDYFAEKAELLTQYTVRQKTISLQIKKLENRLATVGDLRSELRRMTTQAHLTLADISDIHTELDVLRHNLKNLGTCPTCKQAVKDTHNLKDKYKGMYAVYESKLEKKTEEQRQVKVRIKEIEKEIASLFEDEQELRILKTKIDKLDKNLKEANEAQYKIDIHLKGIKDFDARILDEKNRKPDLNTKEVNKRIQGLREKYLLVNGWMKTKKRTVDNLTWVSKEALSNKGLKAYIFDTMLEHVNARLKHYEQFVGFRAEFKVDFDSANKDIYTVVYTGDNMIFYEDLSGGQAQLIDVVSAFAIHDVISHGRGCSLLVMDELFEGLDEENVDVVFELLQFKAHDKSLFLITHQLSLQNSSTKVIRMALGEDGRTIMKQL